MDNWTKSQITHLSTEADRQKIRNYAVSIIDLQKGFASGSLVEMGRHLFVATAAHVIPAKPSGRLWLVKPQGSYDREGFPSFIAHHRITSGRPDVGILELSKETASKYFGPREYCSIDRIKPRGFGREKRGCIVVGCPSEKTRHRRISRDAIATQIQQMPYFTIPLMPDEWPTVPPDSPRPDSSIDIFFDYPSDNQLIESGYWPINLPNPTGMSGGGIWDQGFEQGTIWSTDSCKLFGIQSSWYEKGRYIRGVQIIHWLRLVYEHYPDLRDLLASRFPELTEALNVQPSR